MFKEYELKPMEKNALSPIPQKYALLILMEIFIDIGVDILLRQCAMLMSSFVRMALMVVAKHGGINALLKTRHILMTLKTKI